MQDAFVDHLSHRKMLNLGLLLKLGQKSPSGALECLFGAPPYLGSGAGGWEKSWNPSGEIGGTGGTLGVEEILERADEFEHPLWELFFQLL